MVALPEELFYSEDEYLAADRAASYKSEYIGGHIIAMTGASTSHNRITFNLNGLLYQQLKGGLCEAFTADMRVRAASSKGADYYYPDVVVVCGVPLIENLQGDTLLNPTVVIEVLSPSTEIYDRGTKFANYRQLASLQEYVLVSQDRVQVERFTRQGDQWMLTIISRIGDSVALNSINCSLPINDIYDKVEF